MVNRKGLHAVNPEKNREPDVTLTEEQTGTLREAQERLNKISLDRTNVEHAVALAQREMELLEREIRVLVMEEKIVMGEIRKLLNEVGVDSDPDLKYTLLSTGEMFLQRGVPE